MKQKIRCGWHGDDPLYISYHDNEWGRPVHDDKKLFEALVLDGAQAGLSWIIILRKREAYRKAFVGFDPKKVAKFGVADTRRLLGNAGIVRNRLKINSAIKNAQAFLIVQKEFGTFDKYLWGFVNQKTIVNHPKQLKHIRATSSVAEKISKDLKSRGFTFVGPTIIYAMMQAIGMVDDHLDSCFRKNETSVQRRAEGQAEGGGGLVECLMSI